MGVSEVVQVVTLSDKLRTVHEIISITSIFVFTMHLSLCLLVEPCSFFFEFLQPVKYYNILTLFTSKTIKYIFLTVHYKVVAKNGYLTDYFDRRFGMFSYIVPYSRVN